jgi:hypothetical protein
MVRLYTFSKPAAARRFYDQYIARGHFELSDTGQRYLRTIHPDKPIGAQLTRLSSGDSIRRMRSAPLC